MENMKKSVRRFAALGGLALFATVGQPQTDPKAGGHWEGTVQMPNRPLSVAVDLERNSKGVWIGSISIVGSSAIDVPLDTVTVAGAAVRFTAGLPEHASFDGQLAGDGGSLSGTASNAAGEAPYHLTRKGDANVKVPPPSSPLSKDFVGSWEGTHEDDGMVRHVGLKLRAEADGTAVATLIAVDHWNLEIPVTSVAINGKELRLEARAVSGTYSGVLGASGEIIGHWSERPNDFPLTFRRVSSETKPKTTTAREGVTPMKGLTEEIIAMERSALDRWITGDPDGYLNLYSSEITYFDPMRETRIDGLKAMTELLEPIKKAKVPVKEPRYEMIGPKVQPHGDVALLTFNLINYGKMGDQPEAVLSRWNCTEIYARIDGTWKIIHSHWSFTKPEFKRPGS